MGKPFRPLLAAPADFNVLDYTDMVASPKYDGIRAIVIDGVVLSRSLKPIPNLHVQELFCHLEYFDGELIFGSPTSPTCYRDTYSAVMSEDGKPWVTFFVFDHIKHMNETYAARLELLQEQMCEEAAFSDHEMVSLVEQHVVKDAAHLDQLEERFLRLGYEGLMLRKLRGPNSAYKQGRSTVKQQTLLKVKRMESSEAEILEVIELQRNLNEAVKDERGYLKRSSHQENKVGGGIMGALRVRDIVDGSIFDLGTGFTQEEREWFWQHQGEVLGRIVTYDHFPVGRIDLPRHPSYKGLRDKTDM